MNEGARAHISRQGRVTRPIFENHGSGKGKGGRTRVNKLHLEHVRSRYALLPPGQEGGNSIRRLCGTQKPLGARRGEGEFFFFAGCRIKGGWTFLNYGQGDAKDVRIPRNFFLLREGSLHSFLSGCFRSRSPSDLCFPSHAEEGTKTRSRDPYFPNFGKKGQLFQ